MFTRSIELTKVISAIGTISQTMSLSSTRRLSPASPPSSRPVTRVRLPWTAGAYALLCGDESADGRKAPPFRSCSPLRLVRRYGAVVSGKSTLVGQRLCDIADGRRDQDINARRSRVDVVRLEKCRFVVNRLQKERHQSRAVMARQRRIDRVELHLVLRASVGGR